jgi:hypothetical protein
MVEWELSGLSSMWGQKLRRGGPGPIGAGGLLCAGNSIATALAAFTQGNQPWKIRGRNGGLSVFNLEAATAESATRKAW